jgi:hypothetical protein
MGMQRNRSARKAEAQERDAARAALTDQQQLDRLNSLFGEGLGAKKERARLAKTIVDVAKTSAPKKSKSKKKVAAKKEE